MRGIIIGGILIKGIKLYLDLKIKTASFSNIFEVYLRETHPLGNVHIICDWVSLMEVF